MIDRKSMVTFLVFPALTKTQTQICLAQPSRGMLSNTCLQWSVIYYYYSVLIFFFHNHTDPSFKTRIMLVSSNWLVESKFQTLQHGIGSPWVDCPYICLDSWLFPLSFSTTRWWEVILVQPNLPASFESICVSPYSISDQQAMGEKVGHQDPWSHTGANLRYNLHSRSAVRIILH